MRIRSASTIALLLLALAAIAPGTAQAVEDNPYKEPLERAASYFTALEGSVSTVKDGSITAAIPDGASLVKGMRIRVYKKGKPFLHPVTRKVIVHSETEVGLAEVMEGGALELIRGEASPGDTLRISSAPVRALFFQDTDVKWDVAEDYFYWLKDIQRFSIAETAPGEADPEAVAALARDAGAEMVVMLSMGGTATEPMLRQTLLWASDGKVISEEAFPVTKEGTETLTLGQKYFAPNLDKPISKITLTFTAQLIASGDVNGDGTDELIMASGSSLRLYKAGTRLEPAFGQGSLDRIKGKTDARYVWLETADIDHDGMDEILVSWLRDGTLRSTIYKYSGESFKVLWEDRNFIRSIDGIVFEQPWNIMGGFAGSPTPLSWKDQGAPATDTEGFPVSGIIYNLAVLRPQGQEKHYAIYDDQGHLSVLDSGGREIWKSQESWGGFIRSYERPSPVAVHDSEWEINDRLLSEGGSVLAFRRMKKLKSIAGFGSSETRLMGIFMDTEGKVVQTELIKDIKGGAVDYAVSGGKLYVISSSMNMKLMNLFRGRALFVSVLDVYQMAAE